LKEIFLKFFVAVVLTKAIMAIINDFRIRYILCCCTL